MHRIRKPKLSEVLELKRLVDYAYEKGYILPRTLEELYENVRDFYVYADEKGLAGCISLHIDTDKLAEVRTLVVREDAQRRGIGSFLLKAVLAEAKELEIPQVYVLTRVPEFFEKKGFRRISLEQLPYKIRKDCARCPKFDNCDEVAMIFDTESLRESSE